MPIPSFNELFANKATYFEGKMVAKWEQATETKNKSSKHAITVKASIEAACKSCIPEESYWALGGGLESIESETIERLQRNFTNLKERGQLAFLWAHINEISTVQEPLTPNKQDLKKFKRDQTRARDILTQIQTTLLQEMQDAMKLGDLIHHKAFLCANLSGMSLISIILNNADLRHANLSDCDFNNTSLAEADLGGANLENADLTKVLKGVSRTDGPPNVSGLSNINLRGANLSCAKYKHADIMAVETRLPKGHFYQTKFGTLPDSYNKNPAEKQALENKIRESYAAVRTEDDNFIYDPAFLKLIQASGFSPLTWGDRSDAFEAEYKKWAERPLSDLLTQMDRTLDDMLSPDSKCGYMQSRSRDVFKHQFFQLKESRSGQLAELGTLKNMKDPTIEKIADGLLKVSSAIRLERNLLTSELLNQIEKACKHPEVKGLEP